MTREAGYAGPETPAVTRVGQADWPALRAVLDAEGAAILPGLLDQRTCAELAALYGDSPAFRSHVVMGRHGFGRGEYRYFAYPLPPVVQALRTAFYPRLVPIANDWHARLGLPERFPEAHADFLAQCRQGGQTRPTPLLLRYGPGDYNCLHQDLYGARVFPIQAAILLSAPGSDFTGGEFVLTEQRPRMQSRVQVVPLRQGDAVLFAVNHRPQQGVRGDYRVAMRHGVSPVRSGARHVLGIIFHDAA